ncbi:hypothetical protein PBI_KAMPE_41 [Gordonia phage Kampe]|uniref:Uncharacterized protein n=3 Tax=Gordonia phage Orchid TaxID=1838075 RepID=A0A160DHH6_9CAUD|nr:hypothetical protein BH761_gp040 [Gordonia phage Orchid]ANA87275.1 hypothetical protein PBI_PATRICKSTAR_41 [Gordonia phage PatrickStar]ANA87387.1 hypothetical protein PBI_ORCHID_40 [Gordonia phage Orchid]ANA87502.1 hypothetical protein PBI_KAMPE_41 [Gordonia phage Kampe]
MNMHGLGERIITSGDLESNSMDMLPIGTVVYNTDSRGSYSYFIKTDNTSPYGSYQGGCWRMYDPISDSMIGGITGFSGNHIFTPLWALNIITPFTKKLNRPVIEPAGF